MIHNIWIHQVEDDIFDVVRRTDGVDSVIATFSTWHKACDFYWDWSKAQKISNKDNYNGTDT